MPCKGEDLAIMSTISIHAEPDFVPYRRLWSVTDVSDYLGVPVRTIYQWRTKDYGPRARVVGRHLRFKPDEVFEWLDAQTADHA